MNSAIGAPLGAEVHNRRDGDCRQGNQRIRPAPDPIVAVGEVLGGLGSRHRDQSGGVRALLLVRYGGPGGLPGRLGDRDRAELPDQPPLDLGAPQPGRP